MTWLLPVHARISPLQQQWPASLAVGDSKRWLKKKINSIYLTWSHYSVDTSTRREEKTTRPALQNETSGPDSGVFFKFSLVHFTTSWNQMSCDDYAMTL